MKNLSSPLALQNHGRRQQQFKPATENRQSEITGSAGQRVIQFSNKRQKRKSVFTETSQIHSRNDCLHLAVERLVSRKPAVSLAT
jgi:hypothetical protein